MTWFPWVRHTMPNSSATTSPAVPWSLVEPRVDDLRRLLLTERARIRPDSWHPLWQTMKELSGLQASWDRTTASRAEDALAIVDLLDGRILPGLEGFLALPDGTKPAHADEFRALADGWRAQCRRRVARLARAVAHEWRARDELDGD